VVSPVFVRLCFSLVMNHPFVDGNKRIGHAAMETFLVLNGCSITVGSSPMHLIWSTTNC
jgi:prophage maintenance system killer protein